MSLYKIICIAIINRINIINDITLDHEILDDAMKLAPPVARADFAWRQLHKVVHCLGHNFTKQTNANAACSFAIDGDVKYYLLCHFCLFFISQVFCLFWDRKKSIPIMFRFRTSPPPNFWGQNLMHVHMRTHIHMAIITTIPVIILLCNNHKWKTKFAHFTVSYYTGCTSIFWTFYVFGFWFRMLAVILVSDLLKKLQLLLWYLSL